MKLLKSYLNTLAAMDIYPGQDNHLVTRSPNCKESVVKVGYIAAGSDKQAMLPMVLPTSEVLKLDEDFTTIKFNPMAESYLSKAPSEVQKRLVFDASTAIMFRVLEIFNAMVYAVVDTANHENLSPEAFFMIEGITAPKDQKAAEKMIAYATRVLKAHSGIKGTKAICRFRQRSNVTINDKLYLRVTELMMPFMQQLQKEQPAGIKPPNAASGKMIRIIAKRLEECLWITSVCESRDAPYFISLLEAYGEVVKQLTILAKAFNVELSDNFTTKGWFSKIKDLPDLYNKELRIRFPGNEGLMDADVEAHEAVTGTIDAAPVAVAAKPVVQQQVVKPTPVATTTQPVPSGPIQTQGRNNMAIISRNELNAATQTQATEYSSRFGAVTGKPKVAAAPVTIEHESSAQPAVEKTSAAPVVERAPVAQPSSSAPVVEKAPVPMVHVMDANRQPLYCNNGQPYMLAEADVPKMNFLHKTNTAGQKLFNRDGTPILREANVAAPAPAANPYNTPQYPQQAPVSNPYAAADSGRPGFGASAALANPYGVQQQPQQNSQIILLNRQGQQVQAQFDATGAALDYYWTSQGQQITHYTQLASMAPAGPAPVQQPVYNAYSQPQTTQPMNYAQPMATTTSGPMAHSFS